MKKAQNDRIRMYLETGKSLTAMDALVRFNCLRLAARIKNLRDDGVPIKSELVHKDGKKYSRYFMDLR